MERAAFVETQKQRLEKRLEEYNGMRRDLGKNPDDDFYKFKVGICLPNVILALDLIKQGKYGLCIGCGDDIPMERLKKVPAAVRCTACQNQHEKGGRDDNKG